MRSTIVIGVVATCVLLTIGARPARAVWLDAHLSPKSVNQYARTIRVEIKNSGRWRLCTFTIAPDPKGRADALRAWSHGSLYVNPQDDPATVRPQARGAELPLSEKRSEGKVTCSFRLTPKQLAHARFEFWDSDGDTQEEVAGGYHYWFNVSEFLPAKK